MGDLPLFPAIGIQIKLVRPPNTRDPHIVHFRPILSIRTLHKMLAGISTRPIINVFRKTLSDSLSAFRDNP